MTPDNSSNANTPKVASSLHKMTRDEIMRLEANPETDALVAEKVMGWTRPPSGRGWNITTPLKRETLDGQNLQVAWMGDDVWRPTSDISAAFDVVDKIQLEGNVLSLTYLVIYLPETNKNRMGWQAEFRMGNYFAVADTAALAICRAALLAVMGE